MHSESVKANVEELLDPLHLVHRDSDMHDTVREGEDALSEKSLREQSIRRNRRQKFVDCITSEDVSMGAPVFTQIHSTALTRIIAQLRKLAWNGVPEDLRPIAWPLLLVSS